MEKQERNKRQAADRINFNNADYSDLLNWKKLHDYIIKRLTKDKPNYIFLDEIQIVSNFRRAVESLNLRPNTDIYLTGSNSKLLSGEFVTLLKGYTVELKMQPLSFEEYVSVYPYSGNSNEQIF